MIDTRTKLAAMAIVAVLPGCGSPTGTQSPTSGSVATSADVVITFDGQQHACVVALRSEEKGSTIACNDVVAFVRDELRVAKGSIYAIRIVPEVDGAQVTGVEAGLQSAGYRASGAP
jgi:hypothetical protein